MAEDKMQKKVKVTNTRDGSTSYITYSDLVKATYANLSKIGLRNIYNARKAPVSGAFRAL